MVRSLVCALAALVVCAGSLMAEEIKGKIKKVDADAMTVTVTTDDGRDQVVHVGKDTRVTGPNGKDLKSGIKSHQLKEGTEVTVTTEMRGGKTVATGISLKTHKEAE